VDSLDILVRRNEFRWLDGLFVRQQFLEIAGALPSDVVDTEAQKRDDRVASLSALRG